MARRPRRQAWKLPDGYEIADIYALRALNAGTATEEQQKRATKFIIEDLCAFREEPFRSDSDGGERETAFALGKQSVARGIVYMLTMPDEAINKLRKSDGGS